MAFATTSMILMGAYSLQYVKPEFKFKRYFKRWAATNLLLVCPAEEALFRIQIQNHLLKQCNPQFALLLSSLLFGAMHFSGGGKYMALAFLAGWGYGRTMQKTGDIRASIAVHFILNFIHFIGFTYPALASSNASSQTTTENQQRAPSLSR